MKKFQKIGFIVNFKKAKLPNKGKLIGQYTILEPIKIDKHADDLYRNFSKDKKNIIWRYLPYGPFDNLQLFKKWLKSFCLNKDPFCFNNRKPSSISISAFNYIHLSKDTFKLKT